MTKQIKQQTPEEKEALLKWMDAYSKPTTTKQQQLEKARKRLEKDNG